MRRCPTCGATSTSDDRYCETDGAELTDVPVASGPKCTFCSEGTLEGDGFCSSCGRRSASSRPTPALLQPGSPLAGGTVVSSSAFDEHLVRMPSGTTVRVVLADVTIVERQAEALERVGGRGVFPSVVDCGVDAVHGSYLALALPPGDAKPLREVVAGLSIGAALAMARRLLDAAQTLERLALAWEPQRDDVYVLPDGSVRVGRVRMPRRLIKGERLDARAVLEPVGAAFVPAPAQDGPPRTFRLFLPHIAVPGEVGSTVEELRGEVDAIERELQPPKPGSRIAGVCDPGLRRPHNEDAFACATGTTGGEPWAVLVVCDGVSSSSHADQASSVAAKTACDALAHFARSGDVAFEPGATAVATAIRAAHVAVCAQGIDSGVADPPGTTIVVGLVWRRRLTVGWVGDSRAYWVSESGSELLTTDHSWANDAIARGEVTPDEAKRSPLAHALTRCLGPLEVVDPNDPGATSRRRIQEVEPEVRARDLPGSGWIVLCSDGFWNYFSGAGDVAALVRSTGLAPSPERIARTLVNQALVSGGHDNTTVLAYEHR